MDELSTLTECYLQHLYEDSKIAREIMRSSYHLYDEYIGDGRYTNVAIPLPERMILDLNDDSRIPEFPSPNKRPRIGKEYQATIPDCSNR